MRINIDGVFGELTSMPGCSQIVVSHDVFIPSINRGGGIAKQANKKRQDLAFGDLGYDMMICSVSADNHAQKEILRSNGWDFLTCFTSRKTAHTVELWACYRK